MRLIEHDTLLEMTKLTSKRADESLCGEFDEYIYFSQCLDGHGPRVKFYGGTKETEKTTRAPSLAFTNEGKTELILQKWMNRKNCPNAFDKEYVAKIENFIKRTLPILLLVWYDKLDDSEALLFFQGTITLEELLDGVYDIDDKYLEQIKSMENLEDLHNYCLNNKLYKF